MWREVKKYAVFWDGKKHKGIIKVLLVDDVYYTIVVKSPKELNAIRNILRKEKNVSYNIRSGSIACNSWKPQKEEQEFS